MHITVDLINLSFSAPLNGDLLKRVQIRKYVFYKHLRVFGCKTYVHILKDDRLKLDDKVKECIFLGYKRKEFRHKLQDSAVRKLIRSRNVVFLEDQIVCDEKISIIPTSVSPPVVYNDYESQR